LVPLPQRFAGPRANTEGKYRIVDREWSENVNRWIYLKGHDKAWCHKFGNCGAVSYQLRVSIQYALLSN
jgi:hypothetical protein